MEKKSYPFRKMQGLGNDFVVMDARTLRIDLSDDNIRHICDRHHGIGCDQLVIIDKGAQVLFFNTDGSESGACGNASRCVADLLMREANTDRLTLRTKGGDLRCFRIDADTIEVDMGRPKFEWHEIPLAHSVQNLQFSELPIPTVVNMGNPHCVFFVKNVDNFPVDKFGRRLEVNPIFPERANIGFAEIITPNHIRLRVWERGAGETLACGSGACAAVVAGHVRSLLQTGATQVDVNGGTLDIEYDETVFMRGPARHVFTGTIDL